MSRCSSGILSSARASCHTTPGCHAEVQTSDSRRLERADKAAQPPC